MLYKPWVNAPDPNFSHPLVLSVDAGTFLPENQLKVERLNLLTGHVQGLAGVQPDVRAGRLIRAPGFPSGVGQEADPRGGDAAAVL